MLTRISAILRLAFLLLVSPTFAQTNIYIGPVAGDWDDPANWISGVPDLDEQDVLIDAFADQDSVVTKTNTGGSINGTLTITAGDQLIYEVTSSGPGARFETRDTQNHGTLTLQGQGNVSWVTEELFHNLAGANVRLEGGNLTGQLGASPTTPLLWNEGIISGSGTIMHVQSSSITRLTSLLNEGTIAADAAGEILQVTGAVTDSVNPNVQLGFNNASVMRAQDGGTLRFTEFMDYPLHNFSGLSGGLIEAWGDSFVEIENARLIGGLISTTANGGTAEGQVVLRDVVSLDGVTLDAQVQIPASMELRASHFTNQKSITIAEQAILDIRQEVHLEGSGRIELSDDARIRGVGLLEDPTPKLINGPGHTISVTGTDPPNSKFGFLGEDLLVENYGTIEANGTGARLAARVGPPGQTIPTEIPWKNRGIIRAVNGGVLNVAHLGAILDNMGGVIKADETSGISFGLAHVIGGTIRGPEGIPLAKIQYTQGAILEEVHLQGFQRFNNGATLIGTIQNEGTLDIASLLVRRAEGTTTLTGGGEIRPHVLSKDPFDQTEQPARLTNLDNTVKIEGALTISELQFTNRDTMVANNPVTSHRINLFDNFAETTFTNSGVVRATDGAALEIAVSDNAVFRNYELGPGGTYLPGLIHATDNSEIVLNRVVGGILHGEGTGVVRIANQGRLNSPSEPLEIELQGNVVAEDVDIYGTIKTQGKFLVNGTALTHGVVRLDGAGHIIVSGNLTPELGSTLINQLGHTITGDGEVTLTENRGLVQNQTPDLSFSVNVNHNTSSGSIVAQHDGVVDIFYDGSANNAGTLHAQRSSLLSLFGGLIHNSGEVIIDSAARINAFTSLTNHAGGVIDLREDFGAYTHAQNGLVLVNAPGGVIRGVGELNTGLGLQNRFLNHGTLSPGADEGITIPTGELSLRGRNEQSILGELVLEIGGYQPGEYDAIFLEGFFELGGTLSVELVDLFGAGLIAPQLGDTWRIIEHVSTSSELVTGEFDSLSLPDLDPGLAWDLELDDRGLSLVVGKEFTADFFFDGTVDGLDLTHWQADYGLNDTSDANNDGTSDGLDFLAWQQQFGSGVDNSATAAIPEPNAGLLLIFMAGLFPSRCR